MAGIQTIGVCGAGVMGSQLAALFASAGFDVLLFDLDRELSRKGLKRAQSIKPAAFYHKKFARKITPLGYDEDIEKISACDWVVEAIAERLDWKRDLYARIAPHLGPEAVLTSNTSGLALRLLEEGMDDSLRRRFLITHFFNPPRYMHLVEIVPGEITAPEVVEVMSGFIADSLGKGIVEAKDTPNFIANRIGTYGMMLALELTRQMRLTVEEVDAVTGPVMGRPKSATFRTADIVGLDTLAFVAGTAYKQCESDESREIFKMPEILSRLLEAERLGQKSGAGFYKKEGKQIFALDFDTFEYRPKAKPRMSGIGVARRFTDPIRRIHALVHNPDRAGNFAWELCIGTASYAAQRLGEIADDIRQVDHAMKWGFAWELGPFEMWDAMGVETSVRRMEKEGKTVPPLVRALLAAGEASFYSRGPSGEAMHFDAALGRKVVTPIEPGRVVLADRKAAGHELARNWSASLVDLGDGVACLEFHSALQPTLNPLDGAMVEMLAGSLQQLRGEGWKGLVLSHEGTNFCAGANLAMILEMARTRQFKLLERVVKSFQNLTQAIHYAPFPVVAAPFNLTLGGGFEMVAPCRQVVALSELYCGAVEVGVGLIPGAGGNLRVLSHFMERLPAGRFGPMVPVQKAFETIGFGKVSGSAHEAKDLGYLRLDNMIVLARDQQIALAKEMVISLSHDYSPPESLMLQVPGEGGRLAIASAVEGFLKTGTISPHDALIANRLAGVLTGGDVSDGVHPVSEQHLLDLEREAFVSLAGEAKSQERMAHMLRTGKPLRN